jgi:hypothetical protein
MGNLSPHSQKYLLLDISIIYLAIDGVCTTKNILKVKIKENNIFW